MKYIFTVNNLWDMKDYIQLIQKGYCNFRINSVHIMPKTCDIIKKIKDDYSEVNLYYDLPGNKSRIWTSDKRRVEKKANEKILIRRICNGSDFYISGNTFWDNVKVGDEIKTRRAGKDCMEFKIVCVQKDFVEGIVIKSGVVGYGYHVFNSRNYWANTCINEDDYLQFDKIGYLNPEVIAVSFADSATLICEYRKQFSDKKIFAKIESPIAIENINSIMEMSDGIIIGRDDLSAYYSVEEIKKITIDLLTLGVKNKKDVIGASNYFNDVYHYGIMSEIEKKDYNLLVENGGCGIYINETNKDTDWRKYVKVFENDK